MSHIALLKDVCGYRATPYGPGHSLMSNQHKRGTCGLHRANYKLRSPTSATSSTEAKLDTIRPRPKPKSTGIWDGVILHMSRTYHVRIDVGV
ncbi:hypothetical protein Hypma_004777 [Hypsizygus marmoreus]|uniref:Uncharacterized protein n=1 Tax=Hypsizygus marmoreus TaxID=39966 RepID=A0A369J2F9_HYPMA|nr:hypothetical protein Hypma_004777 [Hypsizygus marmoreus]